MPISIFGQPSLHLRLPSLMMTFRNCLDEMKGWMRHDYIPRRFNQQFARSFDLLFNWFFFHIAMQKQCENVWLICECVTQSEKERSGELITLGSRKWRTLARVTHNWKYANSIVITTNRTGYNWSCGRWLCLSISYIWWSTSCGRHEFINHSPATAMRIKIKEAFGFTGGRPRAIRLLMITHSQQAKSHVI